LSLADGALIDDHDGESVIRAYPAHTCATPPCWSVLGGRSMATPHLAGAGAVVRGLRPTWTAAHVRSAVVNTAQQGVLRHPDTGDVTSDPLIVGAGLADLAAATGAVAGLDPVSAAFGSIASGSGGQRTASRTVTTLATTTRTFAVAVADDGADGVTFATSGASFTLAPGASQSVKLTVTSTKRRRRPPVRPGERVERGRDRGPRRPVHPHRCG
jgi:subtilisin family serine protease